MTLRINFHNLDFHLTRIELSLNALGYIPLISTLSGCMRAVFGKIEIITAIGLAALKFLTDVMHGREPNWKDIAHFLHYALHGVANIARAYVEIIPFVNLLMLVRDATLPRLGYSGEGDGVWVRV